MNDDPLDKYEALIVDELCSYQSQLDQGTIRSTDTSRTPDLPEELQPVLNKFRRCLDLIHRTRDKADQPTKEQQDLATLSGYSLPSRIGRFEILERLGVGGFGIVFRGIDPVIKREVAIKIPRPELLGSPELTDRFAREAAAVAQLEHPNIVPVYESDCFEIVPYIVMPFIPGKTLAQWRAEQTEVSARIAAEIVRELAVAVAHAHERGVLHRDLKPGNVLLARRDHMAVGNEPSFVPKLTDFGLAKCANTGRHDTRTGSMIGTASYMSPEQAEGRSRDITARSDIYGLGVILYELLAGAPPFRGANQLRTIQQVLREEPPSLRGRGIKVPTDLAVICLKCLEKSPANRYPTAGDLADDLQNFLNGDPIRARPISVVNRMGRWSRRHPTRATLLATVLLGVLSVVGLSLWYNSRLIALLKIAEFERQTARQRELEARRRSYVSDMRNAKITGDQDNVGHMLKLLERHRPKGREPDVRDFAWWHLRREYDESSRILGTHEKEATAVAMTRDGAMAASGGADSAIRLWSLPDGEQIAVLRGHESGAVESVSFSPDGKRLVSGGEDGTVRVWDLKTFEPVFVRREHEATITEVAFSPRGDVIASGGHDDLVRLWRPETGELLGILDGHTDDVFCLSFHPTEDLLVTGGRDATIRLWDWKNVRPDPRVKDGVIRLEGAIPHPRTIVFEPNGKSVNVGTSSAEIVRFSLNLTNYGDEIFRRKERGNPLCLMWPMNGPLVAALGSSEIHVLDPIDTLLPGEWLRGHLRAVLSIAVSADGRSIVSASQDGTIRLWRDFQTHSRINAASMKGSSWNDARRFYSVQWRGQYLAADFQQNELAIYRMPDRTLKIAIPKSNDDAFLLSHTGRIVLIFQKSGLVTCYRIDGGHPIWSKQLPGRPQGFHTDFAAIDKRDIFIIAACDDELIAISGEIPSSMTRMRHPHKVWQVALLDVEQFPLVAITACHDGYIRFWDLPSGKMFAEHRVNVGPTYSVAVSDDNLLLVTGGEDRKVRVWRLLGMEEIVALPCNEPPGPARIGFLAGSKFLARSNLGISLWSIPDETELLAFPDCGQFGYPASSPDGEQLAIPQHGSIRLIDGRPQ